jgi:E3 ubiquitin-protein ligase makorin
MILQLPTTDRVPTPAPTPEEFHPPVIPVAAVLPAVVPSGIPCRFYLQGSCLKEDCPFFHSEKLKGVSANGIRCTFYSQGRCFKGDSCKFLHSTAAEAETTPTQEQTCSICYSECGINKKKFGLLSHCDHVFCLECIRQWRNKSASVGHTHTCPVCRVTSFYVIPSEIFATGDRKKEIEENYKKQLKNIPCRYHNFGKGVCPFYDQCFYVHLNEDGTPAPVIPKPPRAHRPRNLDDFNFPDFLELPISIPRLWELFNNNSESDTSGDISDFDFDFDFHYFRDLFFDDSDEDDNGLISREVIEHYLNNNDNR